MAEAITDSAVELAGLYRRGELATDGPGGGPGIEVALVTGAGSGIGRAAALRLARDGAAVALFDRDAEGVQRVVAEIEAAGGRSFAVVGDVTRAADIEAAVVAAVAELGGLDAVAACAGIAVSGTVTSTAEEDWQRAIAINLTGVMLTARFAIPAMVAGGGGSFVAIASDNGVMGAAESAAYVASKHGVVGLVRCLAFDHGPQGVRSNVVCPSLVSTPMAERILEQVSDREREELESASPLGRFATPEEVAAAVHHLLSPEASFTNGLVYMIDGGASAGIGT